LGQSLILKLGSVRHKLVIFFNQTGTATSFPADNASSQLNKGAGRS